MKKYRDFTMPVAIYLTVCTSALNIALNRLNRTLSSLPSQISDKVTAHVYERHLSMEALSRRMEAAAGGFGVRPERCSVQACTSGRPETAVETDTVRPLPPARPTEPTPVPARARC